MLAYTWPGNVRELQNVVRHIVVLNDAETVELDMLPPALLQGGEGNTRPLSSLRSTLMPAAPVPPATPAAVARVPEIFTPGTLYAIPAVIGTTIFAGLHGAGVGLGTNAPVAVSVIVVIRLAAYRFGVRGPRPVDATAVVWKRARAARIRPRRQR